MNEANKHIGSDFDDFLEEEGLLMEAEEVAIKRVSAFQTKQMMDNKQRKVIFLDIDGTLNNISCWGVRPVENRFAPECVAALNKITEETEANIVISSTWRNVFKLDRLIDILKSAGVKGNIIGQTPLVKFSGGRRGDEISRWLHDASIERSKRIEHFVILDDNSDMDPIIDHLVQCKSAIGLTEELANKAIEMLRGS